MYSTSPHDRAVVLDLAPSPDSVDPLPIVLAKDGTVILSYVAGRELTVVATFPECASHLFGASDPGSLHRHPLAERGLRQHGAFEIQPSSWAASFDDKQKRRKHFVFTFRDSLFEVVAADIGVELIREDEDTVKLMSKRLYK